MTEQAPPITKAERTQPEQASMPAPEGGGLNLDASRRRLAMFSGLAALFLVATLWGTAAWWYGLPLGGEIRPDPFSQEPRVSNLLYTLPHRALRTMPYVPVGARGTLTLRPRETWWINSPGFPNGVTLSEVPPDSDPRGLRGNLFSPISTAVAQEAPPKKVAPPREVADPPGEVRPNVPDQPRTAEDPDPVIPQQQQQQQPQQQTNPQAQQQQQQQQQPISTDQVDAPKEQQQQQRRAEPLPPLPPQIQGLVDRGNRPFYPVYANPTPSVGRSQSEGIRHLHALDASCVTEALCLLVGERGVAALTRDGGATWTHTDYLSDAPEGFDFVGALPPKESEGSAEVFAITNSGLILSLEESNGRLELPGQQGYSAELEERSSTIVDTTGAAGQNGFLVTLRKQLNQIVRVTTTPPGFTVGLDVMVGSSSLMSPLIGNLSAATGGTNDPSRDTSNSSPTPINLFDLRLNVAESPTTVSLNGVFMTSASGGWSVGEAGALVRLNSLPGEGISSEEVIASPSRASLRNVRFAAPEPGETEPRAGWVTSGWYDGNEEGDRPVVLQTLDGGATWERLTYRHWPAPWVFLTGFLAAWAGARGGVEWRRYRALKDFLAQQARIMGSVAASDKPIGWDDEDVIGLKPIAKALSLFIRNRDTEPPVTFGITGAWGTGKSSLMYLVAEDLRSRGARPVMFNAWHHQTEAHLLAALLETIRAKGVPPWWTLSGLLFRAKIFAARCVNDMKTILAVVFIAALASVMVMLVNDQGLLTKISENVGRLVAFLNAGDSLGENLFKWVGGGLLGGGASLALVIGLVRSLRQLRVITVKPASLMARFSQRAGIAQFEQQLGFRHRFQEEFRQVCLAMRGSGSPGMVIFIDDLDRCRPDNVLVILESVNFLVSAGPCFIVLGIDEEKVIQSVAHGFKDSILVAPDEADESTELKPSGRQVFRFAHNYLEKLINIAVPVPVMDEAQSGALMTGGAGPAESEDEEVEKDRLAAAASSQQARTAARRDKTPPASPWPRHIRKGLRNGLDLLGGLIPVTVVLFFFINWLIDFIDWLIALLPSKTTEAAKGEKAKAEQDKGGEAASNQPQQPQEPTDTGSDLDLNLGAEPTVFADPSSLTHFSWWWLVFLVSLVALMLALLVVRRATGLDEAEPSDRQEFKYALQRFLPLIHPVHPTPRSVKRFQNHTRFLAMLLRGPERGRTWLDRLFERSEETERPTEAGEQQTDATVPAEPMPIAEDKLVALNALYNFDPMLFERDARHDGYRLFVWNLRQISAARERELTKDEVKAIEWVKETSQEEDVKAFLALRPTATTVFVANENKPGNVVQRSTHKDSKSAAE